MTLLKQSVDDWLDQVDYSDINYGAYVPSNFALKYVNFIKLVNGEQGESHKTPVVHMKMLDQLAGKKTRLANLCSRGLGKTTLFIEYLVLFIAMFGEIEGFGEITGMIYVSDSMDNGVKSARKNIEFRYNNSEFLQYWIPKASFTDAYLEFENRDGKKLGVKMFGAKTGLRGTKIFGKRPTLAVLDDLVSDEDANSKAAMETIKNTVYKGVDYALDPTRRKIVFNGTPFNKNDILYEAVESGGWHVNVWPICDKFPCSREEFVGAWEDRFSYDYVKEQYDLSVATGKVNAFMQELMLRISSEEERLVQDAEIRWYDRAALLRNKYKFNYYITTDIGVSERTTADPSVISVWAYNNQGDWYWVDGLRKTQLTDVTIAALFEFVKEWNPLSVGIEVTGQQAGFIPWIQNQMIDRNTFFNMASWANGHKPGIRPTTSKLARFTEVVPLFKMGKIYFPNEMRGTEILNAFEEELRLATITKLKSKHDDCLDTISMLILMGAIKPAMESARQHQYIGGVYGMEVEEDPVAAMSSYIV